MKKTKTFKVVQRMDLTLFTKEVQEALDEGYELKSSSSYPIDNYSNYVAFLIKEV